MNDFYDEPGFYVSLPDFPSLLIGFAWFADERCFEIHLGVIMFGWQFADKKERGARG